MDLEKKIAQTNSNDHNNFNEFNQQIDETNLTPAVLQYLKIKKKYPDCLLLFRMGDFYEAFFDDAKILSEDLQIILTSKGKGEKRVPLAGIPYHSIYNYLKKLIEKGRKIAVCEQLEDPKYAKGLIKRDVVRIITPGTIIEDNLLSTSNNFILSVYSNNSEFSFAISDISTGELYFWSNEQFSEVVNKFLPAEVLLHSEDKNLIKALEEKGIAYSICNTLSQENAITLLKEFFRVYDLSIFNFSQAEIIAVANLIKYLIENMRISKSHFTIVKKLISHEYLEIDSSTSSNLELVKNLRDGTEKNTLFQVLNFTKTPMGRRLLKNWILKPLRKIEKIKIRLNFVKAFFDNYSFLQQIADALSRINDIDRILTRINLRNTNKRDLQLLSKSLESSIEIIENVSKAFDRINFSEVIEFYNEFQENHGKILELLNELNNAIDESLEENVLIKRGYSKELDNLKGLRDNLNNWLITYEESERKRTGIKSLKVKYNSVFGFFIEVSKANLDKVPKEYIRKQTQVSSERFITDELRAKEIEILNIDERISGLEKELFENLLKKIDQNYDLISKISKIVSYIDCIHSLAFAAIKNDYVMPEIHENYELEIYALRHPVMEKVLPYFIPNDVKLTNDERVMIITGPNMAGKSTIMRKTAIAIIMAHIGSFVSAKKAKIPIVDKIFSRIGARDDIISGQSTFMVEMLETAFILNNATEKSFIILDEIGRGTSTYDGMSLAYAIAEHIAKDIRAKTMFATHYHQLNELENSIPGVVNYYVEVKEEANNIIFTYRLMRGKIDKSYGIYVAKLAGLPEKVLRKAETLMELFERKERAKEKNLISTQSIEYKQNKLFNFFDDDHHS
ncbi:MAG: DNA mismatch repair protein MutS [Candidatus Aenigmatarchaeota archaeon]